MKMKKKTLRRVLCVAAFALAVCLAFLGCGPTEPDNNGSFTPPTEEDPFVTELLVSTPPTKTTYKTGQLFDATGMKLLAKWSDGEDEDLNPGECKQSPTGPLSTNTTEITFTYEGVSCTQAIEVSAVGVKNVTIDTSMIGSVQPIGALDLTQIVVTAFYDDGSEEPVTSAQYVITENDKTIPNPKAYIVTGGMHTLKVSYLEYEEEIVFSAFDGFSVPLQTHAEDDLEALTRDKESFLVKPNASDGYGYFGAQLGERFIANLFDGAVLRFYIYMESAATVDLGMRAASSRLVAKNWDEPTEMGEQKVNEIFKIEKLAYDETTKKPVEGGAAQSLALPADLILPGAYTENESGDQRVTVNFVNISLGNVALDAGYNIIEITCTGFADFMGMKRVCHISDFTVNTVPVAGHTHNPVKTEATSPDCIHYGTEAYYTCKDCGYMFADEACTQRLLGLRYIQPARGVHTPGAEATCLAEQTCAVCGKVLAPKAPHKFEQDICEIEGEAECLVCGQKFPGGHVIRSVTTDGVTKTECMQCDKVFAVKIQAEDTQHVKHLNKSGQTIALESYNKVSTTNVPNDPSDFGAGFHAVSNGSEGCSLNDVNGGTWQGATMEISVHVTEAGKYTFATRAQYGGETNNGSESQDLTSVLSYCVNPTDGERTYTPVSGKAVPASRGINWNRLYLWGITVLAEVDLRAGDNTVVLKIADVDGVRACQFDSFIFEKKGELTAPEAQILTWDGAKGEYNAEVKQYAEGTNAVEDEILFLGGKPVYLRIALTAEAEEALGFAYRDVVITEDMLSEPLTFTAGTHRVTVTYTHSYGETGNEITKTYSAVLEYTV